MLWQRKKISCPVNARMSFRATRDLAQKMSYIRISPAFFKTSKQAIKTSLGCRPSMIFKVAAETVKVACMFKNNNLRKCRQMVSVSRLSAFVLSVKLVSADTRINSLAESIQILL